MRGSRFGLGALLCTALLASVSSPPPLGRDAVPPDSSPFGVNAHVPTTADFRAMREAGFRWARVDLTWNWVEEAPGVFRWDELDRLAADARQADIRLVGILGYCPSWASSGPDIYHPPRSTAQWKRYVRAIVGRYRGDIRHWILWNEPNNRTFFRGTVQQYITQVLVPGARAVKEADPGALVCGPDLAHLAGCHWDTWMDAVLSQAGGCFDVITHHCYKDTAEEVFRQLEGPRWFWEAPSVLQILRRHHQETKPFFLTEAGWRSNKIGEKAQADRLDALLRGRASRPWIRKMFIYELCDSSAEPGYGLLRRDRSPKPAFVAVKRFIASHPGTRP